MALFTFTLASTLIFILQRLSSTTVSPVNACRRSMLAGLRGSWRRARSPCPMRPGPNVAHTRWRTDRHGSVRSSPRPDENERRLGLRIEADGWCCTGRGVPWNHLHDDEGGGLAGCHSGGRRAGMEMAIAEPTLPRLVIHSMLSLRFRSDGRIGPIPRDSCICCGSRSLHRSGEPLHALKLSQCC